MGLKAFYLPRKLFASVLIYNREYSAIEGQRLQQLQSWKEVGCVCWWLERKKGVRPGVDNCNNRKLLCPSEGW